MPSVGAHVSLRVPIWFNSTREMQNQALCQCLIPHHKVAIWKKKTNGSWRRKRSFAVRRRREFPSSSPTRSHPRVPPACPTTQSHPSTYNHVPQPKTIYMANYGLWIMDCGCDRRVATGHSWPLNCLWPYIVYCANQGLIIHTNVATNTNTKYRYNVQEDQPSQLATCILHLTQHASWYEGRCI